ncbi:Na/Pi cotransporter family protein [bacterium]|nr:Na/Pi cotransporter family protein [bacterium]
MRYLLLATLTLLLFGCSKSEDAIPELISPVSEAVVCVPPQTNVTLRVKVEGPMIPGLLGGKGQRDPIGGAKVTFSQRENDPEITFPNGPTATTDAGGTAELEIAIGKTTGDHHISVAAESPFGDVSCEFRIVSGLCLRNTRQEILSGRTSPDMLSITVYNKDGKPLSGVPIHFLIDPFSGCHLSCREAVTDETGTAGTLITAGKTTGETEVIAEVEMPGVSNMRGLHFQSVVINTTSVIIAILGGLALFLLGMTMMSEGLQSVAGARLKSILQLFVKNKFTGIVVGTVITAIVQSSSASTVMVVGFVNAGLMNLEQAISVIFGSCIGTTVTPQIMAFGLTDIALPAVLIGLIVRLMSKKAVGRHWGDVIMGFGLLFFGMDMMNQTLVPLRTSPTFVNVFRSFDCAPAANGYMPFGHIVAALIIGTVATMIVQSSAATIGVVMALCGSGLINFYTSFPLVLGCNIGTTITANLAAIGANRKARRAALVNTIIKVGGSLFMLPLFYILWKGEPIFLALINAMTAGEVLGGHNENIVRHVAMANTVFNVLNVIVLVPFTGTLAWICEKLIPVKGESEESEYAFLDERLLKTPALGLSQSVSEILFMLRRADKNVDDAFLCFCEGSVRFSKNILKREEEINTLNKKITSYTAALAKQGLNDDEIALLPELMHISHDIERIGDLAINIFELAQKRSEEQIIVSDSAIRELIEINNLLQKQFEQVIKALENADRNAAGEAVALEQDLNQMHRKLSANHIKRLEAGQCSPNATILFLDTIGNIERIGDHLLNIAQRINFISPYIIKLGGKQ